MELREAAHIPNSNACRGGKKENDEEKGRRGGNGSRVEVDVTLLTLTNFHFFSSIHVSSSKFASCFPLISLFLTRIFLHLPCLTSSSPLCPNVAVSALRDDPISEPSQTHYHDEELARVRIGITGSKPVLSPDVRSTFLLWRFSSSSIGVFAARAAGTKI